MSEHTHRSEAHPGSEAMEEMTKDVIEKMAKYGITSVQISQFFYGGYRYTNLADAIAEAKRHPRAG